VPPPDTKPPAPEKDKSIPVDDEKVNKTAPGDRQMDAPPLPVVQEIAPHQPTADETSTPEIDGSDIAPDFDDQEGLTR
jgi:hypothetical protein